MRLEPHVLLELSGWRQTWSLIWCLLRANRIVLSARLIDLSNCIGYSRPIRREKTEKTAPVDSQREGEQG